MELIEHFDTVIVVDDKSSDNTVTILEALSTKYNNLKIIRNKKYWQVNFLTAIDFIKNTDTKYVIKVDGDNQFNLEDILKLKKFLKSNHIDYLKCDRFWEMELRQYSPSKICGKCLRLISS